LLEEILDLLKKKKIEEKEDDDEEEDNGQNFDALFND
jgi:hypothetical protein